MVAGERRAAQRHLGVGGPGRVKGAADQVAQVHHQVGRLRPQVGQHGVKGEQVAVGVDDGGDVHRRQAGTAGGSLSRLERCPGLTASAWWVLLSVRFAARPSDKRSLLSTRGEDDFPASSPERRPAT